VPGPAQYFLGNRNFDVTNDSVFLVKVPDTIGGSTTLTVTAIVGSGSYGAPPNGRQPDTNMLSTNDGRVLGGFMRDNEIQFVSTSVNPANGASAVYHGVISNVTTTPSLTGRLISIDTLDFGYPNISFSGNIYGVNQSIISFEYTGPRTYPGYGAVLFDGSGYSDMVNIRSGENTIHALSQIDQRWGDYSGSQPDWNDIGSVWVEGIYGRWNHSYGNYLARLSSPYHEAVQNVPSVSPSAVYPNPAMAYVRFEFQVNQEQSFSFMICDMQGRVVDKVSEQYCNHGKNVLQFNTAPLAPGTYVLKAVGVQGENIVVQTFVKK
jgi:hypothetical protein